MRNYFIYKKINDKELKNTVLLLHSATIFYRETCAIIYLHIDSHCISFIFKNTHLYTLVIRIYVNY